jgi:hypothetical protein
MRPNGKAWIVRIAIFISFAIGIVLTIDVAKGQECPDPAPQTSGSHNFRRIGETFEIPIAMGECQAISLIVRWSNGRNNGGLFNLTFFDGDDRPLYTKQISAFITGMFEFPLSPVEQPVYGLAHVQSVPAYVTVQSVYPFGAPAVLSYMVMRANHRPRGRLRGVDAKLATSLQTAPGRLLSSTSAYSVTEVPLPEARELEVPEKRKTVRKAFRIVLTPTTAASVGRDADLIWIDDIPVPMFRNSPSTLGALVFDDAVMRNGAEIAVSNSLADRFQSFPDRLAYEGGYRQQGDLALTEEGNSVVWIKNGVRVIGGRRQSLVQIQLHTNRPFPARESALRLQVGKRLFLDEVDGDHTGRTLTLSLTPEMFGELKDGATIMAFYGKPDGSGSSGKDVWYFGRLNKAVIE